MTNQLPSFQQYQLAFTAHLRDPRNHPVPNGVAPDRMAVYDEIVFNNLFESVSACFPVARKTIGKRAWLRLVKSFLKDYSANTPLFRGIPEEFMQFLTFTSSLSTSGLPPYLTALCHYEWIELYLSTVPALCHQNAVCNGNLAKQPLVFTQAMQLLTYDYAVHKISPKYKPQDVSPVQLLVHRDANEKIQFIELNPITFKLILRMTQKNTIAEDVLIELAEELNHPDPKSIIQFGLGVLEELRSKGIILGTVT